jgi:AraC family transcriptional regulator, alkane utilization regulator
MTATPNHMTGTPKEPVPTDLLSDVLHRIHLASAVFLRGEFSEPWGFDSCDAATLCSIVQPTAKSLVIFHIAVEGRFEITVGDDRAFVEAGDAVVLPYCDMHAMAYPSSAERVNIATLLPMPPWHSTVVASIEGGGERTRILCGYLRCEDLLFNPLLRALPRLIHVRPSSPDAARWREASVRYTLENAGPHMARLPELVLIDCLRQYVETLSPEQGGFLAALREPVLAKSLTMIHARPAEDWTVDRLAHHAAVSRSILADRFTKVLGVSPMRYLTQWRLQLAADLLRKGDAPIAQIAGDVGYESEAAFSRAFKRQLGAAPATFRASFR